VYGIVQEYGLEGLTVATIMAGVILLIFGFAKLGGAIKFIPYPVVTGFTSGIAVIIFSSQVKDFLGLRMGAVPAEFVEKWAAFAENIGSVNPWALAIALLALAIITVWPRYFHKIPGAIIALVVTTAIVRVLDLPVETIASRFGGLPSSLPQPVMPHLSFTEATRLVLGVLDPEAIAVGDA
jgi:SulP family sulfate permease